jgi:hypothetical protein
MKERVDELDVIKIRNFCSVKDPIKKSQYWEKYFPNTHSIKDCYLKYAKIT